MSAKQEWFFAASASASSWQGPYASRDEAAAAAQEDAKQSGLDDEDQYRVAPGRRATPHDCLPTEAGLVLLIDRLHTSAVRRFGWAAEGYLLRLSKKKQRELMKHIADWLDKNTKPARFGVVDTSKATPVREKHRATGG